MVDHLPERDRLALRDEVRLAGDGRAGLEPVGGQQVGFGGVVDINGVDKRMAPADPTEPARPSAGDDPGKEVVVARSPDQMWPERDRGQIGRVGFEDRLLGACLRLRIGGLEPARIGRRLVHAFQVQAVEHDAGRARVDDASRTGRTAGRDHVPRPLDVGPEILPFRPPDPGLRRSVEDRLATLDGARNDRRIGDIPLDLLDAQFS